MAVRSIGRLRAGGAGGLPSIVSNLYHVDEASGTTLTDQIGGKNISTTTGTGTVGWHASGWLQTSSSGWFKTPSLAARCQILVFRVSEDNASGGYVACSPAGKAIGPTDVGGSNNTLDIRVASGWGIHPVSRRVVAGSGAGCYEMRSGGWVMVCHTVTTAAETGTWVIGAASTGGSGKIDAMELGGLAYTSAQPTDAELRRILNYFRARSTPRGIYLTPYDCPTYADLLILTGESTAEGTKLLTALSAGERTTSFSTTKTVARNAASALNTFGGMATLTFASGSANNNPPGTSTKFGMEWGIGLAQNTSGRTKELHILKVAQGSTYLLPGGSDGASTTTQNWTNASGGTTAIASSVSRNSDTIVTNGLLFQLEQKNVYKAEQLARNSGIGYTTVHMVEAEGINDAYIGSTATPNAASYQTLLQARHDKRKLDHGIASLPTILLRPHHPTGVSPGTLGVDPDYPNDATGQNRLDALGFIRAAFGLFASANPNELTLLDGNDYGLDTPGDYAHPSKLGYENIGLAAHAAINFNIGVGPRV